jgi:hypothetical protein
MSLATDICCEESKIDENMSGGDSANYYLLVKWRSFMLQIATIFSVVINIVEETSA